MASLINPPLLDKTGKEILAALTGEEVQPSASQINAPISDATGNAILEAIQNMNKIPAFDPTDDKGKVLTISNDGEMVWAAPNNGNA